MMLPPSWHFPMYPTDQTACDVQDNIETRLFRRGVSDPELREAVELVREYLGMGDPPATDDASWWADFSVFFDDLTRSFSPAQLDAFGIATDTLLVHAGRMTWTRARVALPSLARAA